MIKDRRDEAVGMRAIIAESEPTVRGALCALATQSLGVRTVGEADTALSLRRQVEAHKPDLVVVAWDLVASPADAALAALRSLAQGLRIVVLGQRPDMRDAAIGAGADSYLSKVDPPEVVLRTLRSHLEQTAREPNEPGGAP